MNLTIPHLPVQFEWLINGQKDLNKHDRFRNSILLWPLLLCVKGTGRVYLVDEKGHDIFQNKDGIDPGHKTIVFAD